MVVNSLIYSANEQVHLPYASPERSSNELYTVKSKCIAEWVFKRGRISRRLLVALSPLPKARGRDVNYELAALHAYIASPPKPELSSSIPSPSKHCAFFR